MNSSLKIHKNVCKHVRHKEYYNVIPDGTDNIKSQQRPKGSGHSATGTGNAKKLQKQAGHVIVAHQAVHDGKIYRQKKQYKYSFFKT